MKIVFLSNKLTPHQKPFCDEMYRILGEDFRFIETLHIAPDQLPIGWRSVEQPPYLIPEERYFSDRESVERIVMTADALLFGSAPEDIVFSYLKQGKPAFKYSERIYKIHPSPGGALLRRVKYSRRYRKHRNLYLLCASAYAYADYVRCGAFRDRAYRWGYFPDVPACDMKSVIAHKNKAQILWCGRMIDWKHPELAVETARYLKDCGIGFSMILAGTGDKEAEIRSLIARSGLSDHVACVGELTPAQVKEYMLASGIFLFTSDRQEGWGAVLNEAMSAGCAVIACQAAGATPYLVSDQVNGFVFRYGDKETLCDRTALLLRKPELQEQMGKNAYDTLRDRWSPRIAAERIVELSGRLLSGAGSPDLYEEGPCSKAPMLKDM